jgi:4-amino-4-deoxy-L-arabinose transferase-like glycosyltransferase
VVKAFARLRGAGRLQQYAIPLLLVLMVAAWIRLTNLVPVRRGLLALQDYDEAVWDSTAQLWLQGYLPYRDFFATLPPVGIYLLAGVLRLVFEPWGSGLGLMTTRYASVLYGLLTIALVYLLGLRLSGQAAGVIAAGLLAVDGMVAGIDRLAMLEPPLNLFSVLAMLAYVPPSGPLRDRRPRHWQLALAGSLAAVAALAKTPGVVVVLALITVSLLRAQLREAITIAVGFALAWLVLSAYFLVRCPNDYLRQVYLFQLIRPPDGVVSRLARLLLIWNYDQTWFTLRLGILGGLCIGLLTVWRRDARPWWAIIAWAGFSLLLIVANSSYYPQYYVQWAVPLCLLGGGLLDSRMGLLWPPWARPRGIGPGMMLLLGIVFVGILGGHAVRQYQSIMHTVEHTDSTYARVAQYIQESSSPDAQVLVFEPNYTLLSSRTPAGARQGRFLVDSYGEMLYVNLGLEGRSLGDLAEAALAGHKPDLQPTFWHLPAQEHVLAAFSRADYVVIDGRARYQLHPQTLSVMQSRSTEVFAFGVASVWKRER